MVHPGEINTIKCYPKNNHILATQADSQKIYIWDMRAEITKQRKEERKITEKYRMSSNIPDLILEGHEKVVDYALQWSNVAPILASGGKDRQIFLWDLNNFFESNEIPQND